MPVTYKRVLVVASLLMLVLVVPAWAQLQVGDNVNLNLSGNASFGYTGDYSNQTASDHGMNPSGNADLSGSYYSPNFLSFDVQPFYNQSRVNSNVKSVFESSGVSGTASIFSGSHFPGTVGYSKTFNSSGGLVVPGVGEVTTRGNSDNLNIGWGIRIPDLPKVSFQFTDGNNASSVFGASQESTFHTKTLGVTASDTLAGFMIGGGFHHNNVHGIVPEFLAGEEPQTSTVSSNTYDVNVEHKLPLNGSFSAGAGRSDIHSEAGDSSYNGTIDTVSAGVGFEPVRNLNAGVNSQYTNNLEGSLFQSALTSGQIVPASLLSYSTHSLDINSQATYVVPKIHLTFLGNADRREQTVLGSSISADSFNELATFANDFLGGFVTITGGATETIIDVANSTTSRGFLGSASYLKKVERWSFNGSVNYSRNTQTVLIGYTSTGYGYSGGIGRRLGARSFWSANASGSKSKFNNVTGSDSFNQSYSSSLSMKRFSVSGGYTKADGTSFLTPTGLTPISNPALVTPLDTIIFNGKSYSFGASTTPLLGLVLSATYSSTKSSTAASSATSDNSTQQLNAMLQYRVRKLWITGGYLKLRQGFSITGQPPSSESSFFIGVTRWFNFF